MLVTLNTDASVSAARKVSGYAMWIKCDVGTYKRYGQMPYTKHSVEAEVMAVINGVEQVNTFRDRGLWPKVTKLIINTDCLYTIQMMEEGYKAKSTPLGKRAVIYRVLLRQMLKGLDYEFRHVRAHTEITNSRRFANDWCDKHAKLGTK